MTGRPRGQTAVRKGSGRRMAPSWSINPSATPPGQPEPPGERVSKETPPDPPQPPHARAGGGGGVTRLSPEVPKSQGGHLRRSLRSPQPSLPCSAPRALGNAGRPEGPHRHGGPQRPARHRGGSHGTKAWRAVMGPAPPRLACAPKNAGGGGGKHTRGWLLGVTPGSHLNHEWEELG